MWLDKTHVYLKCVNTDKHFVSKLQYLITYVGINLCAEFQAENNFLFYTYLICLINLWRNLIIYYIHYIIYILYYFNIIYILNYFNWFLGICTDIKLYLH